MAIVGRTPDECFKTFLDHVGPLIANMVPTDCPVLCPRRRGQPLQRTLSFANPEHDDAVPLKIDGGTIYLYMAQELRAVREDGAYRLRTVAYWYKLFPRSPLENDDALVRWEYKAADPGCPGPCRHHVQFGKMAPRMALGATHFDLTRFHMPTGWVLMEEVLRFLVHELGMKPRCGDRWPEVLRDSEDKFYDSFTDRGGRG